ncbi:NYN domain-containing protein [Coraliomargarita algicola]|uniref:NYN domain-containing protein n=1 Tax=Coraliomargarita algicola TaxID=3092156 RepID=A0ABZ0RJR3_9BACT|nr:NYN domain-containing protein [Coraliomargarita sp. J2-16]WPJ95333.1 NYN domain-containing protein [Coraliomargarita sp. J2-16]
MKYLFIDAYNVICATDSLRQTMQVNLDAARDQLADLVRSIHDAEGVRVALVLDSRNDKLEIEHPYKKKTFEYVYAPAAVSADGVIERMVARVKHAADATVVSNDRMVRESVRAHGAIALRPEELFEWSRACESRLVQDARRRNTANAKDFRNGINLDL